jgi:hypothetical protein
MRSKPWSAPFRASGSKPTRINGDISIAILYQELTPTAFTASLHLLFPHFDDEPFLDLRIIPSPSIKGWATIAPTDQS